MHISKFLTVLGNHGIKGGDAIYAIAIFLQKDIANVTLKELKAVVPQWKPLIKKIRQHDQWMIDRIEEYEDNEEYDSY